MKRIEDILPAAAANPEISSDAAKTCSQETWKIKKKIYKITWCLYYFNKEKVQFL